MTPRKTQTRGGRSDEDNANVTACQVRELLDQQKAFYKDLLEQQERSFKNFLTITIETNNKRMDNFMNELSALRESLHYTQKDVDDLLGREKISDAKVKDLTGVATNISEGMLSLFGKLDYLDGQSRKHNIVIDGIPESITESWDDAASKVRNLLSNKLELKGIEFERVQRMGQRSGESTRPRPIIARLVHFKDKAAIMERAKMLKGSNVFINEDYSEAVREKRKALLPELKAARGRGDIAFLRFDKLIVRPSTQGPKNITSSVQSTDTGSPASQSV